MKKLFALLAALALLLGLTACFGRDGDNPMTVPDTTPAQTTITEPESHSQAILTSEQDMLTTTEKNSHAYMPYPVTTAVAEKHQKATDWTRSYLQNNKAAFVLIIEEILGLQDYLWGVSSYGNGFLRNPAIPDPNWIVLSHDTQRSIEAIDADFRKEFGQDISVGVDCNGVPRDDGRRAVNFFMNQPAETPGSVSVLLSYFPDGYAGVREDTPYVDFGDGWHCYCGDWI